MIKITEIATLAKHMIFQNEVFINLVDFLRVLELDLENQIKMDSCVITPYYIADNKRMELYQYEFLLSDEYDFEDYILIKTGKKKIENIPDEVLMLRNKCFAKANEKQKLIDYLHFLLFSQELKNEVESVFGDFYKFNLYVSIY